MTTSDCKWVIDGKFNVEAYHQHLDENNLYPHRMTYAEWIAYIDSKVVLSDNLWTRYRQGLTRLSQLKHWFYEVEQYIKNGVELREDVVLDFYSRTQGQIQK